MYESESANELKMLTILLCRKIEILTIHKGVKSEK